ncbi:MAG TPA: SpoIID/LytB domain-containing protein [Bacteroidales bacterium]|nr:SpoIID/LytB domain-containing protein [Bacteroidales bacterium]
MKTISLLLFLLTSFPLYGRVSIRIFADRQPASALFTVTMGEYLFSSFDGEVLSLKKNDQVLVSRYNNRLAIKTLQQRAYVTDSVMFSAVSVNCSFAVTLSGNEQVKQSYNGDLKCISDLGTIVLLNLCDENEYLAGVVLAEGGSGKYVEFFKTQAVIARTYMNKYLDKHSHDGYNLCDNTHCQAFRGLCRDTLIKRAVSDTRGLVILDKDSTLIISAFHSNCGGETASPEDVWLTKVPYLRKVSDPYCLSSRNAKWNKKLTIAEWDGVLKKLADIDTIPPQNTLLQNSRSAMYSIGSINVPLRDIRSALALRSTYFSVSQNGSDIILNGRGYGHGVGLCQEGAMSMAGKGFSFLEIIKFYYYEIFVLDISFAKKTNPLL